MATKRGVGVSGVALLVMATGAWLVYVGIRDVPPVGGLRDVLRGRQPEGKAAALDFSVGIPGGVGKTGGLVPHASGNIVSVYGIKVDSSIEPAIRTLVDGARPNLLTGGGHRTASQQAETRRKNGCTCSDSSTCCKVPTAPVGSSMHEQGLAVDFSWNGTLIRSKTSAGYRYLTANAPGVGLKNLPSEPWHWSTNGR